MLVSWFSAGVSSFIAAYIEKNNLDKIIYTHIEDQHEDTIRFLKDCEKVLGKEIEILQSPYSKRVWIVAEIPSSFNKDACFYRTFVCNDGIWSDREVFRATKWALLPLPDKNV